MVFKDYTLHNICSLLDINDVFNLSLTNKTIRELCVQFVKLHKVIEVPLNTHAAVNLANKHYKVKHRAFGLGLEGLNIADLRNIYDLGVSRPKSHFPDVIDVSPLRYVTTLDLSDTSVKDVSMLGKVRCLTLCFTNVTDVSALGGVDTLILCFTNVEDVSMLGSVRYLDVSSTKVKDVSALGEVEMLVLQNTEVEDVSMLGKVHTLCLRNTKVRDYSALKGVKRLLVSKGVKVDETWDNLWLCEE